MACWASHDGPNRSAPRASSVPWPSRASATDRPFSSRGRTLWDHACSVRTSAAALSPSSEGRALRAAAVMVSRSARAVASSASNCAPNCSRTLPTCSDRRRASASGFRSGSGRSAAVRAVVYSVASARALPTRSRKFFTWSLRPGAAGRCGRTPVPVVARRVHVVGHPVDLVDTRCPVLGDRGHVPVDQGRRDPVPVVELDGHSGVRHPGHRGLLAPHVRRVADTEHALPRLELELAHAASSLSRRKPNGGNTARRGPWSPSSSSSSP